MRQRPSDKQDVSQAAKLMGKRSWQARVKRHGLKKLKMQLSKAGKAATRSGRPRLPDDRVKPGALYQRARRARLRAEAKLKKGETKNGKSR